jgi:hypothetical protein
MHHSYIVLSRACEKSHLRDLEVFPGTLYALTRKYNFAFPLKITTLPSTFISPKFSSAPYCRIRELGELARDM